MPQSFACAVKTGRPRGVRPKIRPKTVAEFINEALAAPPQPPPPSQPKPRTPGRKAGIWERMTPEERSAHGRYLASLRQGQNMARTKRRTGTPHGWDRDSVAVATAAARLEAERMVAHLKASGAIAKDDHEGAAATLEALTLLRKPGSEQRRRKVARRLLRHYHPALAASLI